MTWSNADTPANYASRLAPLLVILASLLVYSNAVRTAFVLDDVYWIESGMKDYTIERLLHEASHNRRWLTRVTLACNYFSDRVLGGTGFRPEGYKVVNILIHASAALTLFALARRVIDRTHFSDRVRREAPWIAMAIAMLWAVHPLQTQAVTYVIQRSESLMALFFLLSLYAYVKGYDSGHGTRQRLVWYSASIASALAGAWCKEVMVVLPVVAFFFDCALLGGSPIVALHRRGWVLALIAVAVASPFLFAGTRDLHGDAVAATGATVTAGFDIPHLAPWQYLLAQSTAITHYLNLSLWPRTLVLDYTGWPIPQSLGAVVGPMAFVSMLGVAVLWAWLRKPWVGFLGAFFFTVLAPTSSVFPIVDIVMEHRLYLPLAALSALGVALACGIAFRVGDGTPMGRLRVSRRFLIASVLLALVTIALGARTLARNRDYRTALTMYAVNAEATPNNPRAWRNLASEFVYQHRVIDAIPALERCVALTPFDAEAQRALGAAYLEAGRPREALPKLRGVLNMLEQDLDKGRVPIDMYLARAPLLHFLIGRCFEAVGTPTEAEREYRESLRLFRGDAEVHIALGRVLESQQRYDEAIEAYRPVIEGAQVPIDVLRRVVWLIATGDLRQRDIALMERFAAGLRVQAMRTGDVALLDTVAAADARAGRYESAIQLATHALTMAKALDNKALAGAIEERLTTYRSSRAWTRPTASSQPSDDAPSRP